MKKWAKKRRYLRGSLTENSVGEDVKNRDDRRAIADNFNRPLRKLSFI
ncbi:hypothetical protein [Candidatus Regiella insecticola]|nr:hypothetical protein [Candidatus Regiella insecticola]